ncbi:enolase C-terminal domain-like protein [Cupriavidus malaysiensis]|uniref:Mandelate racemase n=1 Tax=Cupriavidus malaysiensis TaxID=367825 RepID=A0ABN4TYP4_9BURK|nr:enolase C-terminal domain-like protein [Cupriavidus malaysiensis]AOZ10613.1 mandelate racemase [Cupriavidus malaysiensis]
MSGGDSMRLQAIEARAYRIPTETAESDGTLCWDSETLVVVNVSAGGITGMGYGYSDASAAALIGQRLAPCLVGRNAFAVEACWQAMAASVRNLGRSGLCAQAIATVDIALWDLKARLLGVSLARLLGVVRDAVPAYGSGGFTSMNLMQLREQAKAWSEAGFGRIKIKIGRDPAGDVARVSAARQAAGPKTELYVDANGAYRVAQAIGLAHQFADYDVSWLEEPVSSDDIAGLRQVRRHAPPGMAVSAGEYAFTVDDFRRLLQRGAVDVLQADASRCGVTGWLQAAALCEAFHTPLSSHCVPALHATLCCVAQPAIHVEVFHDHARIEHTLFDGVPPLRDGCLRPWQDAPGFGLTFKERDAQCYLV